MISRKVRAWPCFRMRYALNRGMTAEQRRAMQSAREVPFVPMEAISDRGELDLSRTRPIAEVSTGYSRFFEGDVIVAKITPCFENGKGAFVRGTSGIGFGTTELHVLSPNEKIDGRFLYYVTVGADFRGGGATQMTGSAGQKRVPDEFIQDYKINLPPVPLQHAIADYLDRETATLDAMVAAKERLLELLAEKRGALVAHAVTRGLNPNAPIRDSGIAWLGSVPAHWQVHRLKFHLWGIEQGWSPQCLNIPADHNEWGVLKAGCVNGPEFDPNENKKLPEDLEPIPSLEVQSGDVLMSRSNTVQLLGSTALVKDVRPRLLLCDKLYRLSVREQTLHKPYLVQLLRCSAGRFEFERDATGASNSMQNIGQDSVKNVWLPIPPLGEQVAIYQYIVTATSHLDSLARATQATVELIRERRAALIASGVTGEIDVEAAA